MKKLMGKELIREYKRKFGSQSLIAFSAGKDSIATALTIRDHVDLYPIYYYAVPDLEFVEENLRYYECKLFGGRRIMRYPDYRLLDWLDTGVHQTMRHMQIIDAADFTKPASNFKNHIAMLRRDAIEQEGLDHRTLTAVGVRANDSPRRRMSFIQSGSIRPNTGAWFPCGWDSKDDVIAKIKKSGLSLPPDYLLFGKSWDGRLTPQFLIPIKKHFPSDYRQIETYFPIVGVEIWKYERAHGAA